MTQPPRRHSVVVREHPTAPTATWTCTTCGTDEGAKPQSSPFANARATEHAGGTYTPEPWQDEQSPADLAPRAWASPTDRYGAF